VVGTDGAPFPHPGAAYVFVRSGKAWPKRAKLVPADGSASDNFGDSVAIFGSTVVAGNPNHASLAGSAYVFVSR
jgi:FG-GAP repeat